MAGALRDKIDANVKPFYKVHRSVRATMERLVIKRLRQGTCFKIVDLVTVNKANGYVCWWSNMRAEGVNKMVLKAFKPALSIKHYIPVDGDPKVMKEAKKAVGKLSPSKCEAVDSALCKPTCAFRARHLNREIIV
jgi:hypothetical protein